MAPTRLRDLLTGDAPLYGAWITIPDTFSAELMGAAGFDWVCVDMQHGLTGPDRLAGMLQAIDRTGTPALVRVPWNQPDHIMRALDAGARGVIVPMVNSAEEARRAVAACRYPPAGNRSWGPLRGLLLDPDFSVESANHNTVCVVMIETREAVAALDEILAVPGIDAVYIGPNDLGVTHGFPPDGAVKDPGHARVVLEVLAACRRHGVVPGIHCSGWQTVVRWRDAGFRMLNTDSDSRFLSAGAQAVLGHLRGQAVEARGGY